MNIPKIFDYFTDLAKFQQFIEDLIADCVHGIKLPYLSKYSEITHYGLVVEAQQFVFYFSEVLLEMNNANKQEVQRVLDKLSTQMDQEKHQIFTQVVKENYKGMTKQALSQQIALSKYVLIDYNWNLNLTVSSDKMAKSQIPTLMVEFVLQTLDSSCKKKRVIFEMSKEELERFVAQLQKLVTQLQNQ